MNLAIVEIKTCENFGECDRSCGFGEQKCENTCDGGQWGSDSCPQDKRYKTKSCKIKECRK